MCRCLPPVHPVAFLIGFAQTSLCCGLCELTTLALVGMTLSVQLPVMEMWLADNQRPFGGYGCFPALALGGAPLFYYHGHLSAVWWLSVPKSLS